MGESDQANAIQAFIIEKEPIRLKVLNQTLLPGKLEFVPILDTRDGHRVIVDMLVRGAPCIAAVACLSMIVELHNVTFKHRDELISWLHGAAQHLGSSRPTAVNLRQALDKLLEFACNQDDSVNTETLVGRITEFCLAAIDVGAQANRRLGDFGAVELMRVSSNQKVTILTHCNTGSLATVGHGTALGVIRSLWARNDLKHAYCTETRPYNQGSRLTAWELVQEKIPATLIADNMVAYLMETREIDAVVVGADRVTRNGDTANKIGTLQLAVIAQHYKVPFYVAAPSQSIDLETVSGHEIKIEQRPSNELRYIGTTQLAPDDVQVWNPCFDVTPASLISGIITEFGVSKPGEIEKYLRDTVRRKDQNVALF